jgi:hypothetical protein
MLPRQLNPINLFLALLSGKRKKTSVRGVFRTHILYFVLLFFFTLFLLVSFYQKPKKLESLIVAFIYLLLFIMSSLDATTMSLEKMIFAFKQKNEESFKEAWSRIYDWHGKT